MPKDKPRNSRIQPYFSFAVKALWAPQHRGLVASLAIVGIVLMLFQWTSTQFASRNDNEHRRIRSSGVKEVHELKNFPAGEGTSTAMIQQISILGERNSGTRWIFDHLKECFGHALQVEKNLTRYKHWFQFEDSTRYPHDTLVLAQFRNPYDWLKAMERVPHHAPNHLRTRPGANVSSHESENDWHTFLTRAWTMPRVGRDLMLPNEASARCQEDFLYRDIVSCVKEPLPLAHYKHKLRYSEHQPFYEMRNDGSGKPYDNILDLRSDKIRNFLSVRDYPGVADVWIVQYEYLLMRGTAQLLRRIQYRTGVKPNCSAIDPQPSRQQKKSRIITPDFAKHVRCHLNWTVEAMVGYEIEWLHEERNETTVMPCDE